MNLSATMTLDGAGFLGPLRAIQSGMGGVLGQLSNVGNILGGLQSAKALIADTLGALNKPIMLSAEMESVNAEFGVLLGNAEKGKRLTADLQNFANVTPFQLAGLSQNAKTLLAFGNAGDSVLPTLRMLGDVAGASQEKLDSLTLAFAQTSAAGKLTGQDLLQYVNAGFSPLQEISRTTGRSLADLRQDMENGAISAEMVAAAFKSATSDGGRFFGNMQVQSRTFNGLLSTLQDSIAQLYRAFGTPVMNALKPILEQATAMSNSLAPVVADLGERFAKMVTAAGSVASTLSKGLIGASQAGELGKMLQLAFEGVPKFLLSSLSVVGGAFVQVVGTGLQAAFKSAIALLTDGGFWGGLMNSALSIVNRIKAVLQEAIGNLIQSLPFASKQQKMAGAELVNLSGSTRGLADAQSKMAQFQFNNVDVQSIITKPFGEAAAALQDVFGKSFSQLGDAAKNNPEWKALWEALEQFAAKVEVAGTKIEKSATDTQVNTTKAASATKAAVKSPLNSLHDVAGDNLAKVGGFIGGTQANGVRDDLKRIANLCDKVVVAAKETTSAVKDWKPVGLWGTA